MEFIPAVFSAASSVATGNAQSSALKQDAAMARQQGAAREQIIRRHNSKRLSSQRAAYAQAGFDPGDQTAIALQGESAANLELDALTKRYESEISAIGMENKANAAKKQGQIGAFSSLMSAGASYFGGTRIGPPAPVEDRTPTMVLR